MSQRDLEAKTQTSPDRLSAAREEQEEQEKKKAHPAAAAAVRERAVGRALHARRMAVPKSRLRLRKHPTRARQRAGTRCTARAQMEKTFDADFSGRESAH